MAMLQAALAKRADKRETKQERLDRCAKNFQKWGEVDGPDLEWLLDEINKDRALMRTLLRRPDDPRESDLRRRLGVDERGVELRDQEY